MTALPRLDNERKIRSPRGPKISCKSWLTEAPLRMLMNNLDAEVAEKPQELVVYGGIGRAARDWQCFDRISQVLKELGEDETLLVQSGKPVGVFKTHADAPGKDDRRQLRTHRPALRKCRPAPSQRRARVQDGRRRQARLRRRPQPHEPRGGAVDEVGWPSAISSQPSAVSNQFAVATSWPIAEC